MKDKRKVEIVVLSDLHLGTYGCRAEELLQYLNSIRPEILILNGDIIDIWQFSKRYFPPAHMQVIRCVTKLLTEGTQVYYITGNHDELLRKFKGFELANFQIVNKLSLPVGDKKAWIFHGDVFDVTMKHSKWLAVLGGFGYDTLIRINTVVNWTSEKLGYGRLSFSKKIKNNVKGAIKFINDFENTVADLAISNHFDYVICGHIHQPEIREIKGKKGGSVVYMNSGDWIENLSALEYQNGKWELVHHRELENADELSKELLLAGMKKEKLFHTILEEFQYDHSIFK